MSENDKGFTVNDRRLFSSDEQGNITENAAEQPATEQPAAGQKQTVAQEQAARNEAAQQQAYDACQSELDSGQYRNLPPVEFGSFIISLAHAAMMHLGHLEDPHGNKVEKNLELARHTIDTLAMLKDKTKGNLSEEEQSLLDGILTELRMLFVHTCKSK